ncbi:30S ribosomal protein S13 [Candidatus Collierbacteria bacterium]|nr:30S ribosomal protein S13 [Candidatus Collierbacteria bacterium]
MPRISGVDIPENKRVEAGLRYLYGIGQYNSTEVLHKAEVNPDKRAKDLTADEISRIAKGLEGILVEGELRKQIRDNVERLKRIGSYRGHRHAVGLPVRGQRTRTNARTKRGKRMTVGALKKEEAAKQEQKPQEPEKK